MTNTILDANQQAFLEEIILQHRSVVTYDQLVASIHYSDEAAKRRCSCNMQMPSCVNVSW